MAAAQRHSRRQASQHLCRISLMVAAIRRAALMVAARCIRRAALMGAAIRRAALMVAAQGIHRNQTARQEEASMAAAQCICRIPP